MTLRNCRAVLLGAALVAVASIPLVTRAQNQPAPPATPLPWAYPLNPPAPAGAAPAAPADVEVHVPGSTVMIMRSKIRNFYGPPDWHPNDHPPMPNAVGKGRAPDLPACGFCHYPNGQGRPENSSLAGLNAAYIEQQMKDWRNGLRKSSEPQMGPPAFMARLGKVATAEESREAALYFSSLKPKKWITVKEAATVPKTRASGGMLIEAEGGGTEPIGNRIVEMPEDLERAEARDSLSPFVAYVPPGSIQKGKDLATTGGNGRTVRCASCHGANLKGIAIVPSIAGRSPSYLMRSLWDFQKGNRAGEWSPLMKEAVAKLTIEEMVNLVAYASSLEP